MDSLNIIARIENDLTGKFGIPRQSGLTKMQSRIVFEPPYRVPAALRGIEGYSYLWLIWLFSESKRQDWSPTVRPPILGGNTRMGVFATRSPYRPNPIGLSSVKLESVERGTDRGDVLIVSGADIMNGTPILDIKPYLAYTDSHPEAEKGFALTDRAVLRVEIPVEKSELIPSEKIAVLRELLSQDPRPRYQHDPERVYTMSFGGYEVSFCVNDDLLTVTDIKSSGPFLI